MALRVADLAEISQFMRIIAQHFATILSQLSNNVLLKMMKRHWIIAGMAAAGSLFIHENANAVPAFPGAAAVTQPDGTVIELRLLGDEYAHVTVNASGEVMEQDSDGFWRAIPGASAAARLRKGAASRAMQAGRAEGITSFPRSGEVRSLILLVDFPDVPFVTPDVQREFSEMLNLKGFDRREHIGSAADYFRAQSMGQFSPQFDVYGPVRADRVSTYYGENDANGDDMRAHELAMEICRKLDGEINFADYDLDGDGMIDNVYFFYAGYGENFAGNKAAWIWPHANHIETLGVPASERTFDGKVLNSYGCCAELYGSTGTDVAAIGTFCHEFGHILGLPDTYDVNYSTDGSGNHPDQWDIMASGSYLPATRNCGAVPAGYTALERWLLGWADPVEISKPQHVELPALHQTGSSVRISTEHPDEFFLLENRQNTRGGYDRYIPSHGLLVWHVDRRSDATISVTIGDNIRTISCADAWNLEYNAINMNATHQCLEIEKASGNDGSKSSLDTPFPGRQMRTEFTDATSPAMTSWSGSPTGKPVTAIREADGVITFDFMGGAENPVKVLNAEATDITENSFTANWQHCAEASDGYTLKVYAVERGMNEGMLTIDETLTSLPADWTVDGEYSFREGALALGGNATATLSTPAIDLTSGGTLTVRARQGGTTAGTLTIECGSFSEQYYPTDQASNYVVNIPAEDAMHPVTIRTERRKPILIERVTLQQDVAEATLTLLADKCGAPEAGITRQTVEGLEKGREYAYTVEARGYAGSASPMTFVTTSGVSAIGVTETAENSTSGEAAKYYTLDGRRINTQALTPGIYIRRCGASATKLIIK